MTLTLPTPIASYFAADTTDSEAVSQCFTDDAVVKDEGHTYTGRAAIQTWKAEASAKYQYTSEPKACEQRDTKFVVTSRLTGNFPGSPVNLRVFFGLEGDKIADVIAVKGAERIGVGVQQRHRLDGAVGIEQRGGAIGGVVRGEAVKEPAAVRLAVVVVAGAGH